MIVVIFEVMPRAGQRQRYLDTAAKLRPLLEKIDGFISIERFQSLSDENKILSLSFFRDEEAIAHWRNLPEHRTAQKFGRTVAFADYRLRIAGVIRDYGMTERDGAPGDSAQVHTPAG